MRKQRTPRTLLVAIAAAAIGVCLWLGVGPADVAADGPRGFLARQGLVSIQLDRFALEALGWQINVNESSEKEVDALRREIAFAVAPTSTMRVEPAKGQRGETITGALRTRGGLLLTGVGDRVVLGDFAVEVGPDGLWTVVSTLDGPDKGRVIFELMSMMTDFSAAESNLRVIGELSVAKSWAKRLGMPEAGGIVVGVVQVDAKLTPVGIAVPVAEPESRGRPAALEPASGTEGGAAGVVGADIIIGDLQSVYRFGRIGDITAWAVGTNACNIGTARASWIAHTNEHPVIMQNIYRLKENRFEQVGMSWVKHGFYAVSQSLCTPCTDPTDGTALGVGCSDPYSAQLNGVQTNMSLRSDVNAHTGYFPYPWTAPDPQTPIDKRMQVHDADLDPDLNLGAQYFLQGHYVHPDDCAAGTQNNNASYRRVAVSFGGRCNGGGRDGLACIWSQDAGDRECWVCADDGPAPRRCERDSQCPSESCLTDATCDPYVPYVFNLSLTAAQTQRGKAVIRAWQDTDSAVMETDIQVPGEGLFIAAMRVTELANGFWTYEYAVENLNSDRSAGSFSIPLPRGAVVENIGFHDVDYHSGEIYDLTDWPATVSDGMITWATDSYDTNPNANALRFGILYNYRFDASVPPGDTIATIGLFRPGAPAEVTFRTFGPSLEMRDCQPNDVPDRCDIDCGAECGAYCGGVCDPPCGQSLDCNGNGMPDECEDDCNDNGIADTCDISGGASNDCNLNGVPDECEPDCDGDGIPDECDTFEDTDLDGIADCWDMCPETTPEGACVCPDLVRCCFPSGICLDRYPRLSCIELGGTPDCLETPCRDGCLLGDGDGDGNRDLQDCIGLWSCFSGPLGDGGYRTPSAECLSLYDFDEDGAIDLADYAAFRSYLAGP